jgi:hypothetical protein
MLQNDSINGYALARDRDIICKELELIEQKKEKRSKTHLGERTGTIHRPIDDDEADVILRPIKDLQREMGQNTSRRETTSKGPTPDFNAQGSQ